MLINLNEIKNHQKILKETIIKKSNKKMSKIKENNKKITSIELWTMESKNS